jgi:hypothetical protein
MASIVARFLLSRPACRVAQVGMMAPALRFLFDGGWFSAPLVPRAAGYARMRPGPAGEARLATALPRG